jgi:hypothetical protein
MQERAMIVRSVLTGLFLALASSACSTPPTTQGSTGSAGASAAEQPAKEVCSRDVDCALSFKCTSDRRCECRTDAECPSSQQCLGGTCRYR